MANWYKNISCNYTYTTKDTKDIEDYKQAFLKLQHAKTKEMEDDLLKKFTKPFYMSDLNWPTEEQTRVSSWKANYRTMANYGISFVDPRRCIVTMKSVDDTPVIIQKSIPNKFLRIVFLVIFIIIFLAIWN